MISQHRKPYFQNINGYARLLFATFLILTTTSCSGPDGPVSSVTPSSDCSQYKKQYGELELQILTSNAILKSEESEENRQKAINDIKTLLHFTINDATGCATAIEKATAQTQLEEVSGL